MATSLTPGAPRLPRSVARRIDRLAVRAHLFHRWAHHPLCEPYRPEVLRLGRRARVCRGCALAAAGAAAGALAGLTLPGPPAAALVALAAGVALALRWAARDRLAAGGGRLLTRFLPAGAASALLVAGARSATLAGAGAAALAVVGVAGAIRAYRRRGPHRAPCAACPERSLARTCSGYAPIARRERAFARAAARLLRAVPPPGGAR